MASKDFTLTQEYLKERLVYDKDTGIFTNKKSISHAMKGEKAGYEFIVNGKKYLRIQIQNKLYLVHRLAWLYVFGALPPDQIDHINGNGIDNRIINLRCVNNSENCKNRRLPRNSTSGCIGVCWHKLTDKWQSNIKIDGKKIHLGIYFNKWDAICVRKSAEFKLNFHKNHGNTRPL